MKMRIAPEEVPHRSYRARGTTHINGVAWFYRFGPWHEGILPSYSDSLELNLHYRDRRIEYTLRNIFLEETKAIEKVFFFTEKGNSHDLVQFNSIDEADWNKLFEEFPEFVKAIYLILDEHVERAKQALESEEEKEAREEQEKKQRIFYAFKHPEWPLNATEKQSEPQEKSQGAFANFLKSLGKS